MTALAVAGTGSVAPDLVLPPGFDRLGDVVRFEQDSVPPGVRAVPAAAAPVTIREPAAEGQEPALSDEDDDHDCKSTRSLTAADFVRCTRCRLRGHLAGDPDRCLVYRGSYGMGGQAAAAQDQAQWRGGEGRGQGGLGKHQPFHRGPREAQ